MSAARAKPNPVARMVTTLLLLAVTIGVVLVFLGRNGASVQRPPEGSRVFYVVPFHYGFAFYDADFVEVKAIKVRRGEEVSLYVVPANALSRERFLEYVERTVGHGIADLKPGDSRIRAKVLEDLALGNVEHIIGISAHPVYITTKVAPILGGRSFRDAAPATLREAVERRDSAIELVTFTAKRVGLFDVLCLDADPLAGTGTCGWAHKWMIARGALVVDE